MAACFTHPLDLLKVHLQTQSVGRVSLVGSTVTIIRHQGVLAMYNGLSASILRQLTYSTTRFGMYEVVRQYLVKPGENMKFYQKVFVAGVAGATGGFVGTPADMVNVRMQNDVKLPAENRRNDNLTTHFSSSLMAAGIATTLTQPLDVMKTRMMNAKPGEYRSILHCALETKKFGIMAFFKGYIPAF
ncbi:hypothetical protein MRX96_022280 [Rhipicephalus microplus]